MGMEGQGDPGKQSFASCLDFPLVLAQKPKSSALCSLPFLNPSFPRVQNLILHRWKQNNG